MDSVRRCSRSKMDAMQFSQTALDLMLRQYSKKVSINFRMWMLNQSPAMPAVRMPYSMC